MDFKDSFSDNFRRLMEQRDRPLWEKFVPEEIRHAFPEPCQALASMETGPKAADPVIALFWKLHTLPESSLIAPGMVARLQCLLDNRADRFGSLDNIDFGNRDDCATLWLHVHIAGSLATLLRRTEAGCSERLVEVLDDVAAKWDAFHLWLEQRGMDIDNDSIAWKSFLGVVGIALMQAFRISISRGEHERALLRLSRGLELMGESGLLLYRNLANEEQSSDVGIPLDEEDMEQEAVDAFEALHDNPRKVESWKDLARLCKDIELHYDAAQGDRDCWVTWKGKKYQWFEFWPFAVGLCGSKLSPTEYEELRERDLKRDAERRLQHYFFHDCWLEMPEGVRRELVTADCLFMEERAVSVNAVYESLRLAVEELMRPLVWDGFAAFREKCRNGERPTAPEEEAAFNEALESLSRSGHQPTLSNFIHATQLPSFREFLRATGVSAPDAEFLLELGRRKGTPKSYLMRLRARAEGRRHPKPSQGRMATREEVAPLFRETMGMGCPSVLRRLGACPGNSAPRTGSVSGRCMGRHAA